MVPFCGDSNDLMVRVVLTILLLNIYDIESAPYDLPADTLVRPMRDMREFDRALAVAQRQPMDDTRARNQYYPSYANNRYRSPRSSEPMVGGGGRCEPDYIAGMEDMPEFQRNTKDDIVVLFDDAVMVVIPDRNAPTTTCSAAMVDTY